MWNLFHYVWSHPLNASGKFAALRRVLSWQIASRLMSGPIALPFVDSTFLFANRGMTGATGNWYCGLHEVNEMAFVLHFLRQGEHFVDVGANIGSYTILAGGGVKARVTSVEPIPTTFAHLQQNVLLNGLGDRISCFQIGLSDETGVLRFSSEMDTVNHVLAEGENLQGVDVPIMRLDDLVRDDSPVLIKIDVEGHELSVLRGGLETLSSPQLRAVIMETNGSGARYGVSDDALIAMMQEYGFTPYGYDPFRRRLVDVSHSSGNTVFVRDRHAIEERTQSARKFKVITGEV